jgi:hypothetical protein
MKIVTSLLLIFSLLGLNEISAKGKKTVPELVIQLSEFIKKEQPDRIIKVIPDINTTAKFLKTYYYNQNKDAIILADNAKDKQKLYQDRVGKGIKEIEAKLKELNISQGNVITKDIQFGFQETKEGYKKTEGSYILSSEMKSIKVTFEGLMINKKWYLVDMGTVQN